MLMISVSGGHEEFAFFRLLSASSLLSQAAGPSAAWRVRLAWRTGAGHDQPLAHGDSRSGTDWLRSFSDGRWM